MLTHYQNPGNPGVTQSVLQSSQVPQQRNPPTQAPGDLGFTPHQIESCPPLDLGLENLLRQCDVKETVIQAFRVRGFPDRLLFVAIDETVEGLRSTCKEALGVDASLNFEHKLEFAKISKAWNSAKNNAETKQKIDAIHRAHGEPVQMLEGDWANLIRAIIGGVRGKFANTTSKNRTTHTCRQSSRRRKTESSSTGARKERRYPFGQFTLDSNAATIPEKGSSQC